MKKMTVFIGGRVIYCNCKANNQYLQLFLLMHALIIKASVHQDRLMCQMLPRVHKEQAVKFAV